MENEEINPYDFNEQLKKLDLILKGKSDDINLPIELVRLELKMRQQVIIDSILDLRVRVESIEEKMEYICRKIDGN